jgi:NAD(P)-dependent dehydrogenase (short-subunit alcohol dehydrogenase family)
MDPKGLAAIVTGGGSGLGAETARQLAKAGAKVAVFDLNEDGVNAVGKEIGGIGVKCDVTSSEGAAAAIAKASAAHGPARILINCAGVGTPKRIVGRDGPIPLADFEAVVRVNLFGTFNMLRLVAAEASKTEPLDADGARGVIVNVASVAAFDGQIGQAAYGSSKGAVAALTLPAARELAQFGIRVMAIAPGIISTPMLKGLPEPAQKSLGMQVPFPARLGEPSEFASLVMHIVSNQYLNGEVIRMDGSIRMAPK